jgi:heme a synthase
MRATINPIIKKKPLYHRALWLFCVIALVWVSFLLFAGGFTTTIRAGMAFLDWPLSNGSLNPEGWLQESDQLAEHSHRLLGMQVGLLSLIACAWVYAQEKRSFVRFIGRMLVWMVILQGVLGGARVSFDQLNLLTESNLIAQTFAILHSIGAQINVGLWVALAISVSKSWTQKQSSQTFTRGYIEWSGITVGIFAIQLLIGAIMRHNDAGLAIATFPLASAHSLMPTTWSFHVTIHWLHRLGALVAAGVFVVFLARAIVEPAFQNWKMRMWVVVLFFIFNAQIFLGASLIWTLRNPYVTTLHMLLGNFMLASLWGMHFLSMRSRLCAEP